MNISGLQKLSLVDYEGKTACTIFTSGCNFACPFCHNSSLVYNQAEHIDTEEVINFLEKRKGLLDGVCVSGGEPTLQYDLYEFISKIKSMGYLVKLDTNGTNCELLEKLINDKLIDYVAMDIKNSLEKYNLTTNCKTNIENIKKSINFIMTSGIDYEFRTTLIKEFHNKNDIENISSLIANAKRYYLQKFVDNDNCITSGLSEITKDEAKEFQSILKEKIPNTFLRGY